MVASMTGFARHQAEHDFGTLIWEIRAVNHRYLESSFRLPESLRHLEGPLREFLRQQVQRGKVEAQLKLLNATANQNNLALNEPVLQQLKAATATLGQHFALQPTLNALDVLRWPGLIAEREQDAKAVDDGVLALFQQMLRQFQQQREREGTELKRLIGERLTQISAIVTAIRADLPTILAAQAERIKAQFSDLQLQVEPTRLEQEIVLIAQKADIHEELDRLDTHVKELLHTLNQSGQIGRRLDFLLQEFNREANTICSKAIVTSTTFGAVELKVLIEQIREQVQNIE
jgi:uncharacterized protein (TIGR00255 family)